MYGGYLLTYEITGGELVNTEVMEPNGEWTIINATQFTAMYSATVADVVYLTPSVSWPSFLLLYL